MHCSSFSSITLRRRPVTSFLWFTSPFRTFKNIIWKKSKWYLIGILLLICFILFILLFLWSLPVSSTNEMKFMSRLSSLALDSRTSFFLVSYVCLGDSQISLIDLFISVEFINQFYPLINFYRREANSERVVVQSESEDLHVVRTSMH